jgi:hypothetical protein
MGASPFRVAVHSCQRLEPQAVNLFNIKITLKLHRYPPRRRPMGWRTQSQAARARKRHRRNVAVETPRAIDARRSTRCHCTRDGLRRPSSSRTPTRTGAREKPGRRRPTHPLRGAGQCPGRAVAIEHGQGDEHLVPHTGSLQGVASTDLNGPTRGGSGDCIVTSIATATGLRSAPQSPDGRNSFF